MTEETRFCDKCSTKFKTDDPTKWLCLSCQLEIKKLKTEANIVTNNNEPKRPKVKKFKDTKESKTKVCDECGVLFETSDAGQLRCPACFSEYMKKYSKKDEKPCKSCGYIKKYCACGSMKKRRNKQEVAEQIRGDSYYDEPYSLHL